MLNLDEKRQFQRYPIPTLVDLEFEDHTYRNDFSQNLSETGMYLETNDLLPVGTRMTARFAIPNLDWVFEIKTKVMWIVKMPNEDRLDGKKDGMGLSFVSMDEKDQEKLSTYLKNFKIEDLEL